MQVSVQALKCLHQEAMIDVLVAFQAQGRQAAVLVGEFLNRLGYLKKSSKLKLPRWLFIDLSHVLQIAAWEHQGFLQAILVDLPSSKNSMKALIAKIRKSVRKSAPEPVPDEMLSRQVTLVFYKHFLHVTDRFPGDFLISKANLKDFANAVAQLCWTNRNQESNPQGA